MTDGAPKTVRQVMAVLDDVEARWGRGSQAHVHAAFLAIGDLFGAEEFYPASRSIRRSRAELTRYVAQQFADGEPSHRPPDWVRTVDPKTPVMEFDRSTYEERYGELGSTVSKLTVDEHNWSRVGFGTPRIFVLDEANNLIVHTEPLTFLEFATSRTGPGSRQVTHAMLVSERLRAVAAGELLLVGGSSPCAVVATLKSGHFLPPPSSAAPLRAKFQSVFGIPASSIEIFPVATGWRRP